jgi:hypothetical protein
LILLLLVLLGPMAGMPTLSLDADNGFLLLLAGATTLGLLI